MVAYAVCDDVSPTSNRQQEKLSSIGFSSVSQDPETGFEYVNQF